MKCKNSTRRISPSSLLSLKTCDFYKLLMFLRKYLSITYISGTKGLVLIADGWMFGAIVSIYSSRLVYIRSRLIIMKQHIQCKNRLW